MNFRKKYLLSFLLLIALLLTVISCDTTEPPSTALINLKLEDVSCTEAWMTLTNTNLPLPTIITIKQNDQTLRTINLVKADTLLCIDSLLPNQTYKYQVSSIQQQVSSNELSVTTMDTTSHNFTWQTWTFGENSNSILYDVAIIDENNICAVGEIYLNDSLGQPDPILYNVAIWDGQNWSVQRIPYYYQGQPFYHSIQSVYPFYSNDIWFCGNGVIHWDGINYIPVGIPASVWGSDQINRIWGINKDDIYIVGDNGKIAHLNITNWQKISSCVTSNINDVWGFINNEGIKTTYCAASFVFQPGERKVLRINNNNVVDSVPWNSDKRVHSVWAKNKYKQFACGDGVFINSELGVNWKEQTELPLYYSRRIRGTDLNNILVVGDYGFFAHYSGTKWKVYDELAVSGIYMSVDIKRNICATVGLESSKAVIVMGNRN